MENIAQSTKNIYQVKNERMGGFIPSWDAPKEKSFNDVLSSYSPLPERIEITPAAKNDKFGFLDIIDMINPMQHIPLVNMAYRSITGDEIKPVSKIIGGGIFGGPAGAASGIVSVIIEEETGKDVIGNVISLAGINNEYNEHKAYQDLPIALLSFAQLPMASVIEKNEETYEIASGRTAGTIAVYS